jgi:UDPglucose 6-dehydrogenase
MVQREIAMKIAVIGLGFVGLVTSTVLAQYNEIMGIDTDKNKVDKLNNNDVYIYEPGLKELFIKNRNRVNFYNNYENAKKADIAFVCVPTPTINNKIDTSYVEKAVKSLSNVNDKIIIVIKSTVVPGTASALSGKINNSILSNPEFLREGSAVNDTLHPDRIVIGGKNAEDINIISKIWEFTNASLIKTTNENAELIKYASNSFLAVKISFINEIANLCQKIPNADVNVIAKAMGMDHRIGNEFLMAGIGFGGSCFPKDTRAIVSFARENGVELNIINDAINVNNERIKTALVLIEKAIGNLKGKRILLLGLSFKNNTNDLRESKSIELANELIEHGSIVCAYDPIIKEYHGIKMVESINGYDYDCIVISSEWEEFKNNKIYNENKNIIDLRGIVDLHLYPKVRAIGIHYD